MSDQGEKTCPLCMEEMDLTDQQLKPCKCGYEICVWCWHQIMDLAEKEDTEGRCPACRTLYDKEKIVGTASNGRLVAEINSERRLKSQKTKPKASDGRKHLSSVRVIQHNLVYIIGIPSDLADEELLQHKEYFGQYGKVQKVSIARTAGGAIQHSVNNTCSVYITYLREEEAVRCIQSVHGYVLDGKPLRACFGTTKYCHAWLRNMSCSNPDCLYLHEFGSQDDSFTKDETISDYTRNRVQQITGTTNNMQRRSGNMLPPPVDDFCISSTSASVKPIAKSVSNSSVSHAKGSPPNGSSGRSIALPAAASWGLRVSNGRPPVSTSVCLGGVARQKTDANSSSFPAVGTSAAQGSTLHLNVATKSDESGENLLLHPNSSSGSLESSNHFTVRDSIETISDSPAEIAGGAVPAAINSTNHSPRLLTSKDSEGPMIAPNRTHCTELDRPASSSSVSDRGVTASLPIYTFCNGLSSVGIDEDCRVRNSDISSNGSVPNLPSLRPPGSEGVQQYYQEHFRDPLTSSLPSRNTVLESDGDSVSRELFDWREDPTPPVLPNARSEADDVLLAFDDWRSKVSENGDSSNYRNACSSSISGSKNMIFEADETFCQFNNTGLPNGYHDNEVSSSNVDKGKYFGSFKDDSAEKSAAVDMGESSIISNILSMDLDIWGDSLTSPHDLVKLLSENDKKHTTLKLPSSLKVQNSNQSRFSFARQEDFANQGCDLEASLSNNESMRPKYTAAQDCFVNRDPFEKLRNGFSANMFGESDTFSSNLPVAPHSKHSVSRTQISAPPGFSFPNRAPPPGFSSQERMDQAFESFSGNNLVDSSFLRNQYVGHPTGSFGSVADVELIDPAILAVGKGRLPNGANSAGLDMRSAFTTQQSTSENDPRYFLMQQQISGHQNLRYPDHVGDRFSSFNDVYRGPSRLLEQSQASNFFPFGQLSLHQSRNGHMSNGHWDGWNEVQSGNELGMAELLRNERLGLNKHLSGYEDLKFRMPTSSDIYSRAFGI